MPDRLTEIKARQATWSALPDFREHATGDLAWAVAEIERLRAENRNAQDRLVALSQAEHFGVRAWDAALDAALLEVGNVLAKGITGSVPIIRERLQGLRALAGKRWVCEDDLRIVETRAVKYEVQADLSRQSLKAWRELAADFLEWHPGGELDAELAVLRKRFASQIMAVDTAT